jgi:hypothetical protein
MDKDRQERVFLAGGLEILVEARTINEEVSYWIKDNELYSTACDVFHRTGLRPQEIRELRSMGHTVVLELDLSSSRQWKEGDTFAFYGSGERAPVKAGLFVYSGLGMGNYYSSDGFIYDCSTTEAHQIALRDDVPYEYVDSFRHYKSISVMG